MNERPFLDGAPSCLNVLFWVVPAGRRGTGNVDSHGLMTDVEAALEQQILNVPQAEREAHVH